MGLELKHGWWLSKNYEDWDLCSFVRVCVLCGKYVDNRLHSTYVKAVVFTNGVSFI